MIGVECCKERMILKVGRLYRTSDVCRQRNVFYILKGFRSNIEGLGFRFHVFVHKKKRRDGYLTVASGVAGKKTWADDVRLH
jgi:hypothetical protein